ncbi:SGNH hydrolase-type esterase domain-containing protein [Limtongia smithiae]|uniref:SGNH hydrolase-type esterase domain-containing protein n=1 Tax=Limtongia smithiae TaxID=1125753 RepID=UPI0034CEDF6E
MALEYDKIVLFGDSITQYCFNTEVADFCLGPALQNLYTRKFDIIQRGYGGYTSEHAVRMIDKLITQETTPTTKVKLMIVFFGTNDSVMPSNKAQHTPIEKYKDNLRYITHAAQAADIKVILIGAGPYNDHQWTITRPGVNDRTTIRAREYCDAAFDVAKELDIPFVPMWNLIMNDIGYDGTGPLPGLREGSAKNPLTKYLVDGLHYLGPAYKIEFDGIMRAISFAYPELAPENVPLRLPLWADLKHPDDILPALA